MPHLRTVPALAVLAALVAGLLGMRQTRADDLVRIGFLLSPDAPEVVFFYELAPGVGGDVTGTWIAEDVGAAAPPNYAIDAMTLTLPPGGEASFALTRPTNGWPLGKYRLELRVGDRLLAVEPFVIQRN